MKTKTLGIDQIQFKTYLNILVSNVFLALKFMNFKNMYLTKVIHFFVIEAWMHYIYMTYTKI